VDMSLGKLVLPVFLHSKLRLFRISRRLTPSNAGILSRFKYVCLTGSVIST
jgi:hypothetical protein